MNVEVVGSQSEVVASCVLLGCMILIIIGFIVFVWWDLKRPRPDRPANDDYEHQVRIVQLENGQYVVQRFNTVTLEWRSKVFGKTHFNNLEDAKQEKAKQVKELIDDAGYYIKRVVPDDE